jgi:anti-sigma B factor antagonist
MNFSVRSEPLGESAVVIVLAGEVDLYTAPRFDDELGRAIEGGSRYVIVDLTETTFIDSTTLGVLVGGLRRLRPHGAELVLVLSDPNLRKIFQITGLDRVVSVYETRAAALDHCSVEA